MTSARNFHNQASAQCGMGSDTFECLRERKVTTLNNEPVSVSSMFEDGGAVIFLIRSVARPALHVPIASAYRHVPPFLSCFPHQTPFWQALRMPYLSRRRAAAVFAEEGARCPHSASQIDLHRRQQTGT
eukprot:2209859-Rhodomonas_salina.2